MAQLTEIAKKYTETDYEELLKKAKRDCALLYPLFGKIAGDENGTPYLMIFIGTSLASDGVLSEREYTFLHDLTGIGREEAEEMIRKHGTEQAVSLADRVFDTCPDELKTLLFDLCMCFIAVDKEVSRAEREFLSRLLM